ncbi:aminotransferase class I/II-fold pyridoxal phosphate-dependent enzyme [candidate division KSB3 bacterium]|uniref:Aminotransferase class I/II-fold pyridoxal phosphate-dependent enzyme n=1 Tax=candidate division KSB3 bacterium TaxID=2044937 RepID=A0A9D5JTL4_9BACT|nr:aminotransferase class I/II-fold pyridoxal phosphate-dependent enzyme [candidate division KSB3 bacterium]MBD3323860.1 aminotransferase class I/II-fold pyridoxal phosphate-dependent enzyme [candidate division KSB3 bacterium]
MNERIYLSPPHIGPDEHDLVAQAFATNWIAPLGPHVDAFEKELADYVGIRGALALSSGTAAIHLALRLAGVGPGDTVACSSLTFIGSANPIVYQGATPLFIDAEPASWNMSPAALERALSDAEKAGILPKAAIIVNLYGQSADMDPLRALCQAYHVLVIEDAAESLGATYKGHASGTLGTFGIYSFNGNKILTTSGGGMLISDDLEALAKARFWATQARDPARHYQHSELGYNYRLSNLLAAVGRGQLRWLEERIRRKRRIFDRYVLALGEIEGLTFMPEAAYGKSNRWLTTLTVDPHKAGVTAEQLLDALEQDNIEARPVWKPLHLQPLFAGMPYYPHQMGVSVSERLFAEGLCLPSGSALSEADQSRIIKRITATIKG